MFGLLWVQYLRFRYNRDMPGRHAIDMSGKRCGRLQVLDRDRDSPPGHVKWHCQCDCGTVTSVTGHNLRTGTSSCGCLRAYVARELCTRTKPAFVHGKSGSHEHLTWAHIRTRCGIIGGSGLPQYVRRGMAEEWKHDFVAFYTYIMSTIGPHPGDGWSIDRINNDVGILSWEHSLATYQG